MNVSGWRYQVKRGALEFCIMSMIMQQPTYGYEIIGELQKYPILVAKANTIYPLLGRLLKEGYISSVEQEIIKGTPARKYYSVTPKGLEYLSSISVEWNNLLSAIQEITGRRNKNNEYYYIQPIGSANL